MLTAIRQWVIKTMVKKNTGVVQTLPKREIIELNTQITAERLMRNGINPEALKNVNQVENAVNAIEDTPRVIPATSKEGQGITEALFGKRGEVFDMQGNKLDPNESIMAGTQEIDNLKSQVDEAVEKNKNSKNFFEDRKSRELIEEEIKAKILASNKKSIGNLETNNFALNTITKIKSMKPMDAMKEANLVAGKKGRYSNLNDKQVKKIIDDTNDHIFERDIPDEDFATGGRAGFKGGLGIMFKEFLKKLKVKQSGDGVNEFLSKRKFMKDIVGNTEKNEKARELRMLKEMAEEYQKKKFRKFEFPSDEQIKIDLEKRIQPILNKGRKLNSDGGRIGYAEGTPELKLYPRASGMQSEQEVGPGIKITERDLNYGITGLLEGDKFFGGAELDKGKVKIDVVNPEGDTLFKDTIGKEDAVNFILGIGDPKGEKFQIKTDKDFENMQVVLRKSFAQGGRIGYKVGSVDKIRRLILKTIGAGTAGIAGAKSGIFSFGKGAGKTVAKEVAQQTTSSMPPPYFFELANKIKTLGRVTDGPSERLKIHTMPAKDGKSELMLTEDIGTGEMQIKKIGKEGDEMTTEVQTMEYTPGSSQADETTKSIPADQYDEYTEFNSRIYKDNFNEPMIEDGIKVDEIIEEVKDQAPSIKKAGGGIARMLGE